LFFSENNCILIIEKGKEEKMRKQTTNKNKIQETIKFLETCFAEKDFFYWLNAMEFTSAEKGKILLIIKEGRR